MPANNHDSEKPRDDGETNGEQPSWRDFKEDDKEGDQQRDNQQHGTDSGTRVTPNLPETHFELSETERELINHSPGRSNDLSSRLAQKDKITIAEQFCNRLGTTSPQKQEVKRLIAALNLDRFGNQKRIEKIALVLIRFVVERDRMNRHGEAFERLSSQRDFQKLLEEEEMDLGEVMTLSSLVKDAVQDLREGDDG